SRGHARGGRDRPSRGRPALAAARRRGRSRGGGLMQTLTSIGLVFRMQQFEIVAVGLMAAALVGAALYVANELNAVGYGPCALAAAPPPRWRTVVRRFFGLQDAHANPVFAFMHLLPYAIGLFLGAPLIARELERGTARPAWAIAPSRLPLDAPRVVPVVLFGFLLAFVAGFAVDRLVAARTPGIDLENSFDTFG